MRPDWAYGGAGLPSMMSGYCLFWIRVADLVGKSVQFTVCTFTVMFGFAWWKAVAMASQYLVVLLDGPVP